MMNTYDRITQILKTFDFEKVHSVMSIQGLTWKIYGCNGVPSIALLQDHARRLINQCIVEMKTGNHIKWSIRSNGFVAASQIDAEGMILMLDFVIESYIQTPQSLEK